MSFGSEDLRGGRRSSRSSGASGHVYVIQRDGDDRVKIGSSVDPHQRVRDLQTGSADRLHVAWSMPFSGDYGAVEREAHAILDKHRGFNEWFAVPVDVAVAAISAAAFRLGQTPEAALARKSVRGTFLEATALWTVFWLGVVQSSFALSFLALTAGGVLVAVRAAKKPDATFSLNEAGRWCTAVAGAAFLAIPASLLLQASISHAANVMPAYDIQAFCGNLAKFMGGNDATRTGCETSEKSSKAKVATRWADVPQAVQSQCVTQIAAGSAGNYQALAGCLTLNMGAMWLNGDVKLAH